MEKEPDARPIEREVATVEDIQKIALPFSDTPVIKRNREFRQRGSKGHRRSSTGMRGRRASSLIDNGSDGGDDTLPVPLLCCDTVSRLKEERFNDDADGGFLLGM